MMDYVLLRYLKLIVEEFMCIAPIFVEMSHVNNIKQQKPTEGKYSRLWSRSAIHKVPSLRSGLPFQVPVRVPVSGLVIDSALRVN